MIIFNFKFRDMKKQVLMMAALALALGGCSKTETTGSAQGGTIGFAGSGVNNITKAGDLTDENFTKFYVYGSYQETGGTIVDRFTKQEVTKPENENTWGYTPTQYWANGTWAFGAYYTSEDGESGVTNQDWDYTDGLSFTVNSDNDHQGDLVYADATDITVDDATNHSTPVSLTFKHLLSKIQFKFTMGESVAAYTVKLSNFKVANIITDGTWEKDRCTVGSTKADAGYTDFATAETINATNGLVAGPFYVIPQAVGTDANAFTITFNAEVTDGKTVYKNGTVTATVPVGSYPNWDAQNYYQYSAEINMTNIDDPNTPDEELQPIVFAVSELESWEEMTNVDTTLDAVE